jgi:hypothetical protein
MPLFHAQVLANHAPARRVLYSWTTPEQAEELRRGRRLFLGPEEIGKGRGYAFDVIAGLAITGAPEGAGALAKRFTTELFPTIRYAWPQPWATRMGWPRENSGNQLLRIVLKESAWTALVMNGEIRVVDASNQGVSMADALGSPERIGAIFFLKDQASGGAGCLGPVIGGVTGATYRQFILGNEATIEEWSLGTEEIRQRIAADISLLSTFLDGVRGCPPVINDWGALLACEWTSPADALGDPTASYFRALALASELYLPARQPIANLVDTLRGDLFEPDPLIVRPGE